MSTPALLLNFSQTVEKYPPKKIQNEDELVEIEDVQEYEAIGGADIVKEVHKRSVRISNIKNDEQVEQEVVEDQIVKDDSKLYMLTSKDSRDPSYTNLVLPYRVVCRQRYHQAGLRQRRQFIDELKLHELLQGRALDGVRIHREFGNAYINRPTKSGMIRLTADQKIKIEQIMKRTY